jgi:hypothetical protein
MHVWTFLAPKYQALMNSQTNYGLEEAGMAQMAQGLAWQASTESGSTPFTSYCTGLSCMGG